MIALFVSIEKVFMINVACWISISRIGLAFVTVWCLHQAHYHVALFSFIIAALSDVLDGFIARTCNQMTKLGQILDPVADKIFAISVMIALMCMTQQGLIHVVLLFLLMKEFSLLFCGAWLWFVHHRFIPPSKLSRLVSFLEFCFMFVLLLQYAGYSVCFLIWLLSLGNLVCSVWLLISYAVLLQK